MLLFGELAYELEEKKKATLASSSPSRLCSLHLRAEAFKTRLGYPELALL